jgi:hypothetical protein
MENTTNQHKWLVMIMSNLLRGRLFNEFSHTHTHRWPDMSSVAIGARGKFPTKYHSCRPNAPFAELARLSSTSNVRKGYARNTREGSSATRVREGRHSWSLCRAKRQSLKRKPRSGNRGFPRGRWAGEYPGCRNDSFNLFLSGTSFNCKLNQLAHATPRVG